MKITRDNLRQIIREELSRELHEVAQMYHAGSDLGMSAEPVLTGQVEFDWGRYSQTGGHGREWYYIHPDRNDELGEVQSAGDPYTYTKDGQQAPNVMVVSAPESGKRAIGAVIELEGAWEIAARHLPSDEPDSMEMIRVAARDLSSQQLAPDEEAPYGATVTLEGLTWEKAVIPDDYPIWQIGRELYGIPAAAMDIYRQEMGLRVNDMPVSRVIISPGFPADWGSQVPATPAFAARPAQRGETANIGNNFVELTHRDRLNGMPIPTFEELESAWYNQP
jgi:hypothetical protein|tara:strand:- start:4329 stop:5162 length:834 start_codon:yes stop_codon:yes gene_type:complete